MRNVNTSWRVGVGVFLYIELKGKQELLFDYMRRSVAHLPPKTIMSGLRLVWQATKFKYMQYTHTQTAPTTHQRTLRCTP